MVTEVKVAFLFARSLCHPPQRLNNWDPLLKNDRLLLFFYKKRKEKIQRVFVFLRSPPSSSLKPCPGVPTDHPGRQAGQIQRHGIVLNIITHAQERSGRMQEHSTLHCIKRFGQVSINEQGSLLSFACPHPSVHPSMPPPGPDGRIEICPKLQSGILAHSIPPFVAGFVSCSSCSALLWPGIFYGPSVPFCRSELHCTISYLSSPCIIIVFKTDLPSLTEDR